MLYTTTPSAACVGEETYERLMAFVKLREQRKAEEAANAKAG